MGDNNYNSEGDLINARDEIRLHRIECHLPFPLMEDLLKALFKKIRDHVIFTTSASTATSASSASKAPNTTIYKTILDKLAYDIIGRDSAGNLNKSYEINVGYVLGLEQVPKNNTKDLTFINQFFPASPESTSSSSSAAASSSLINKDTEDRAKERRTYFRRHFRRQLNSKVLARQFDEFAKHLDDIRNKKARLRGQIKVKDKAKFEERYKIAEVADVRFNFLLNKKKDLFLIEIIDKLNSSSQDRLGVHLTIGVNSAYTNSSGIDKTLTYHITDVETGESRHRFYKAMNNSFTGESIKKDLSSSAAGPVSSSAAPVSSSSASETFTNKNPLVLKKDEILSDLFTRFPSALHIDISEKPNITDAEFTAAIGLGLEKVLYLNMSDCKNIKNESLAQLTNLKKLRIPGCYQIRDRGIEPLKNIVMLDMTDCHYITNSLLLGSLPRLIELYMENCDQITDIGIKYKSQLRYISMDYCTKITPAVFTLLDNLEGCDADYCAPGVKEAAAAKIVSNMARVKALAFGATVGPTGPVSSTAVKLRQGYTLSDVFRGMPGTFNIDLSQRTDITDAEFTAAIGVGLENVTILNMAGCTNIKNESLARLTKLIRLNISNCTQITDLGIKSLINLSHLFMDNCKGITPAVFINLNMFTNGHADNCAPGVIEAAAAKIRSNMARIDALGTTGPSSSSVSAAAPVSSSSVSAAVPVSSSSVSAAVPVSSSSIKVKKGETLREIYIRFPFALNIDLSERNDITDAEFTAAMAYGLTNVQVLNMAGCTNIKNESLARLTNLTSLNMSYCTGITDAGLAPLIKLISLNMTRCNLITDASLARLTNLTSLDMAYCTGITDAGLARLTNLTSLDMDSCTGITDASLAPLTNLTSLSMRRCRQITDAGLAPLENLTSLNMTDCRQITDASLARLTKLTRLEMAYCTRITDASLAPLTNLTHLDMAYCTGITDASLARLTNLTSLNMDGCTGITDAGLAPLTNLTSLSMENCERITDASLARLTNLTSLDMAYCTGITSAVFKNLNKLTYCYAEFCAPGVKEAAEAKIVSNRTSKGGTRRRRVKKTKKTKRSKKTKKTKKTRRN